MLYGESIGDTFEAHVEPTYAAAADLRHRARQWLEEQPLERAVIDDAELVIAELVANAVDQRPAAPIRFEAELGDGSVAVSVANRSSAPPTIDLPSKTPRGPKVDGSLDERGRGLLIVEALSDDLLVVHADGWTTVRCVVPTSERAESDGGDSA